MTLASWFSALPHSRRRSGPTGTRRNRSHASRRSASFEALEDRSLLSSVGFSTASETVRRDAGTFSIPVTLSGTRTPTVSPFASGFDSPEGLAFDSAGNLYVANNNGTGEQGDARGDGQHLRHRARLSQRPGVRRPATSTSPISIRQHGERGDARGGGQHLRLPGSTVPTAWRSTRPATSTSPTVRRHGEQGDARGDASAPSLPGSTCPDGLAFDAAGNLYVANSGNTTVLKKTVSEVTPAGVVSTFATGFDEPDGLAFDAAGNLYVVERTTATATGGR